MVLALTSPTRVISPFSRTRRSLACTDPGSSPISSRKSVPPDASSSWPGLLASAPENAPRAWPKSSLSASASGMAAQLIDTNGPGERGEKAWMAAAASSLPTPVSPRMRIGMVERASRRARS